MFRFFVLFTFCIFYVYVFLATFKDCLFKQVFFCLHFLHFCLVELFFVGKSLIGFVTTSDNERHLSNVMHLC